MYSVDQIDHNKRDDVDRTIINRLIVSDLSIDRTIINK